MFSVFSSSAARLCQEVVPPPAGSKPAVQRCFLGSGAGSQTLKSLSSRHPSEKAHGLLSDNHCLDSSERSGGGKNLSCVRLRRKMFCISSVSLGSGPGPGGAGVHLGVTLSSELDPGSRFHS